MNGPDKLLRKIDGVPLLCRTARIATATGYPVFAAIPGPSHERYTALKQEAVTCFDVPECREGLGGSLRGVVKRLPVCEAFMILLADLPDLQTTDLKEVFAARRQFPNHKIWRGATPHGKGGHPILFDAILRSEFATLTGDIGAKTIVSKHQDFTKLVQLRDNRSINDLDTEQDWTDWLASR